ncbi:unnamed protein product [Linum trigynum]|uniref:Uncharacterized protein n=1 Tax=Linum trigynum TaxID=586398 RepID=A0AAV2ECN0_9ROSI
MGRFDAAGPYHEPKWLGWLDMDPERFEEELSLVGQNAPCADPASAENYLVSEPAVGRAARVGPRQEERVGPGWVGPGRGGWSTGRVYRGLTNPSRTGASRGELGRIGSGHMMQGEPEPDQTRGGPNWFEPRLVRSASMDPNMWQGSYGAGYVTGPPVEVPLVVLGEEEDHCSTRTNQGVTRVMTGMVRITLLIGQKRIC